LARRALSNSWSNSDAFSSSILNAIDDDLRTWGANVDAGAHSLVNLASLTVSTGASGVMVGTTDPGSGAWVRNDGANMVVSTNVGSLYLGYGGNTSKTIHVGNVNPGVFTVAGNAPGNTMSIASTGVVAVTNAGVGTFSCTLSLANTNASAAVAGGILRVISTNASASNALIVTGGSGGACFSVLSNGYISTPLVPVFASNAAAITGGLSAGMQYRNGDNLCIVH